MISARPSDTYKKLYFTIIDPLLFQICSSNLNYCVRKEADHISIQYAICNKFEEYKSKAIEHMHGNRLDRHKLASCICGAIIEVKPLVGDQGAKILKNANEKLALYIGLDVIKMYMMNDLMQESGIASQNQVQVKNYLKENYNMVFPENICDTQEYVENFANALYWSHQQCDYSGSECFQYDIWAYAKIFYHLERHNQSPMKQCLEDYLKRMTA